MTPQLLVAFSLKGYLMVQKFRPLNDEQINRLDELLATTPEDFDTFDVSMLDGYLSAIALLNPTLENESDWYPYNFDIDGRDSQVDQPEEVHQLIMQRYQEIVAYQAQREFYNPIIFPLEDDDGKPILTKEGIEALVPWATGFYAALTQFGDRVQLTEEIENQLCKIHRHLELDPDDDDYEDNKAVREAIEQAKPLKNLEEAMVDMMEGVLNLARLNRPNKPINREMPKVGRNDPCPCGSGKKYKQCCGKN